MFGRFGGQVGRRLQLGPERAPQQSGGGGQRHSGGAEGHTGTRRHGDTGGWINGNDPLQSECSLLLT